MKGSKLVEESSSKEKFDTTLGLHYITKGGLDIYSAPKAPQRTEGFGDTVQSILKHAQYLLLKSWNDPNGPGVGEVARPTYMMACKAGFTGHYGEWVLNIFRGDLVHGEFNSPEDKVPLKIKLRETRHV